MKRTFEFQEGNSQKFWRIEANGTDFTIHYGKLGTKGQSQTKSFESEEKCQKEANKLIAEKIKKGYTEAEGEAEYKLACRYSIGDGVKKNLEKAIELWTKAANLGDSNSQHNLGHTYQAGEGVPQDYKLAIEWYEKAAAKNHANAQTNLGVMYFYGQGVKKNYEKAIELWQKAIKNGDDNIKATAYDNIARRYYNGEGVEKNLEKAIELWIKSANLGGSNSQHTLGHFYEEGEVVPQNYKLALKWFKEAAKDKEDEEAKSHVKELRAKLAKMREHIENFEFDEEQQLIIEEKIKDREITKKQAAFLEDFCKKHAVKCYNLAIADGEPTPLDSSVGGIPYCPLGEELPKDKDGKEMKLLIQLNLKGVDLPGYPNKGIFQIFMFEAEKDEDGYIDGNDYDDAFNCVRYYENVTKNYRKDLSFSNHGLTGPCGNDDVKHIKLELEKSWSMYPFEYSGFLEEDEHLFKGCELYKKFAKDDGVFAEILDELFPGKSNIGGYNASPQGQSCVPYSKAKDDSILLSMGEDTLDYGDYGMFYFFYEDMTKLKKDASIKFGEDMS